MRLKETKLVELNSHTNLPEFASHGTKEVRSMLAKLLAVSVAQTPELLHLWNFVHPKVRNVESGHVKAAVFIPNNAVHHHGVLPYGTNEPQTSRHLA